MPWIRPDQAVDPDYWRQIARFLRHPRGDVAQSPWWRQKEANALASASEWRASALEACWADGTAVARLMALCADGHSLDSALRVIVGSP